jgi:peptidoglycan-associated lipoprotein
MRGKPAKLVTNDPDFTTRLDSLGQAYESSNVEQIMSYYSQDTYSLSFDLPWKFTTGASDHREKIAGLFGEIQAFHITPGKDTEVWRDDEGKKAWTTRPLKAAWTMKSGDAYEFDGFHSAIWGQRDGKWLINYEHYWGSVTQTAKAPAPPPPPSDVAPPPPPPEPSPEEVLKDVYFDYDKYNIRADQLDAITFDAEYLVQHPNVMLILEGHCDERGTKRYNYRLGDKRAEAVKKFLVEKGVAAERLELISLGKDRPFMPGRGEVSWQANRRTHFVVKAK